MARSYQVLEMLCPGVEYYQVGQTYEGIDWLGKTPPITIEQYDLGFDQYDAWKAEQNAIKATQRQALLNRLGITEEEATILLGGN